MRYLKKVSALAGALSLLSTGSSLAVHICSTHPCEECSPKTVQRTNSHPLNNGREESVSDENKATVPQPQINSINTPFPSKEETEAAELLAKFKITQLQAQLLEAQAKEEEAKRRLEEEKAKRLAAERLAEEEKRRATEAHFQTEENKPEKPIAPKPNSPTIDPRSNQEVQKQFQPQREKRSTEEKIGHELGKGIVKARHIGKEIEKSGKKLKKGFKSALKKDKQKKKEKKYT